MPHETANQHDAPARVPTGQEVHPTDVVPQGTVHPGSGTLGESGPEDFDDLIVHTGEARGVADTAYHSLVPDAPTVAAAERGKRIERDLSLGGGIPSSSNGPD